MKHKIVLTLLLFTGICTSCFAALEGRVSESGAVNSVVDRHTGEPVANAKVSLPKQKYSTYTDSSGGFNLDSGIKGNTLLSVEKEGYRPYSLTIDESIAAKPMALSIEKSNAHDIVLAAELFHLGDNNFSGNSANSGEFKADSSGPFYTKTFKMGVEALSRGNYLVVGSIIGIDTLMARSLGQNKITHSYSSPPEVYFNGSKIAEISLNGDNQRIKLPNNLIRPDNINEITLKTGKNLMQTAYVDYDDIELMNLSVQPE
ncbi:MAG: carboxypeptidase-like regulatory domain-containing protein [Heliobacteriaceae bacterium]|jgi:hypothetical protein|nr:carboxypeptidase-like regulatory domain-containing protein [Heliobacteriaceae bacterium]